MGEFLLSFFAEFVLSETIKSMFEETLEERLERIFCEVKNNIEYQQNIHNIEISSIKELFEKYKSNCLQPEIKELLEQVINKLRNDPCCYLYYLEKVFLHNMYDNEKVSCLTKLDARYIFPNIKFFSLYPLLDISVNELYIEPIYKIIKVVDHINFDEESYNDRFIERTKDIIDRYRLLFLFGAYGSGKTILSKKLLFEIKDGFSLFIEASSLPASLLSIELREAINSLICTHGKLYIFIDSCEDALINGNQELMRTMQKYLNSYKEIHFIINLRKPDGVQYSEIYHSINHIFHDIPIVQLSYFRKEQIKKWIQTFCDTANEHKQQFSLSYEDIKNTNKNLRTSCENPLILLMMAISSIDISDIKQNWYKLFDDFVGSTIGGKFRLEERDNSFLTKREIPPNEYREFVEEMAFTILKNNKIKLNVKEFENNDFYLDPNNNSYSLNNKDAKKIIQASFGNNVKEKEYIQYLNCYFFEYRNDSWKFKDNNMLFFLCASKYCKMLHKLIENYRNGISLDKQMYEIVNFFNGIQLHPVIIEFILDCIHSCGYERDIKDLLLLLINKRYIASVQDSYKDFRIDYDKIKNDILLLIIFLRINKDYLRINYILKRISQYYSFVKLIDNDLSSIILRYFRYVKIKNAELRSINFKEYNWSNSMFNMVKFIRCKFQNTIFNNNKLHDTTFNLCYFNNMKFDCIQGCNISFKVCDINKLEIVIDDSNTDICFENSVLTDVRIMSKVNKTIRLSLINCDIRQLKINCPKITIYDSMIYPQSNIHIINSDVVVNNNNLGNCEEIIKILDEHKDNKTRIRKDKLS